MLTPRRDPSFRIGIEPDRTWVNLAPAGELDLATVPELAAAVAELRAVGFEALRIDLRAVSFMSTDAISYLLALAAECPDGLRLELLPAPAAVQRVFALTEVEDSLPFLR